LWPQSRTLTFLGGDYVAGRDNLTVAMHCADAIGNPFLHLRLGQCHFELDNFGSSRRGVGPRARGWGPISAAHAASSYGGAAAVSHSPGQASARRVHPAVATTPSA
jgi:hypothetical protein